MSSDDRVAARYQLTGPVESTIMSYTTSGVEAHNELTILPMGPLLGGISKRLRGGEG